MASLLDGLPSWKTMFRGVMLGSQVSLSPPGPNLGSLQACPNPSESCCTKPVANTCCINYPGGQFALTQFWNSDSHAGPPGYLGPNSSWTIHGLWPDHCTGLFDSVCDCSRSGDCSSSNYKCGHLTCNKDYSSITAIFNKFGQHELLSYMGDHWKGINGDEHLWQHEWSKHGTCVSTLEPDCYEGYVAAQEVVDYFQTAVDLHKTLPTFEWLANADITPSETKTYKKSDIEAALKTPRGVSAIVGCDRRHPHELREIWYHFHVRGSLASGQFVPIDPDFSGTRSGEAGIDCPDEGIYYLPKGSSNSPSPTTTAVIPTGTSSPHGKAHLVVRTKDTGGERGCLISNGRWYNTRLGSSCASFKAQGSAEEVILRSSKGPCGLVDGEFSCGYKVGYSSFQLVDGNLVLKGENNTKWSADAIPRGTEQETIMASGDGDVPLEILWRP